MSNGIPKVYETISRAKYDFISTCELISKSPKATGLGITLAATVISRLFFSRFSLVSGLGFAALNYGSFLAADKVWSTFFVRNETQILYVDSKAKTDEDQYMSTIPSLLVASSLSLMITPAIFKTITGRTLSTYSLTILGLCTTAGKFVENKWNRD